MSNDTGKVLFIIAGPNGAGKSSYYNNFFPNFPFINFDDIAKSINQDHPGKVSIQAGKIVLNEIEKKLNDNKPFVIETTLSGKYHLGLIDTAKSMGWKIKLIYVGVSSSGTSIKRVEERYKAGGHNVKNIDIIRRYDRSMINLKKIIFKTDLTVLYDNSNRYHQLIVRVENNKITHRAQNLPIWVNKILEGIKL